MKLNKNESSLKSMVNYEIQLSLWEDPEFLQTFDYLTSLGFVLLPDYHPAVLDCPWLKERHK